MTAAVVLAAVEVAGIRAVEVEWGRTPGDSPAVGSVRIEAAAVGEVDSALAVVEEAARVVVGLQSRLAGR